MAADLEAKTDGAGGLDNNPFAIMAMHFRNLRTRLLGGRAGRLVLRLVR
jgi:hypothetical protein